MNQRKERLGLEAGDKLGCEPIEFIAGKVDKVTHITVTRHGDDHFRRLMHSFGTNDRDFFLGLVHQLVNAVSTGGNLDEKEIKFLFAYIQNSRPGDETETMLRAQMAACHVAAMHSANRLAHAESVQAQDCAHRAITNLTRSFASLVEVLRRYVNAQDGVEQGVRRPGSIADVEQSLGEAAPQSAGQAAPQSVGETRQQSGDETALPNRTLATQVREPTKRLPVDRVDRRTEVPSQRRARR